MTLLMAHAFSSHLSHLELMWDRGRRHDQVLVLGGTPGMGHAVPAWADPFKRARGLPAVVGDRLPT